MHSADDVAEAAEAFRQAVRMLREDEELGSGRDGRWCTRRQ